MSAARRTSTGAELRAVEDPAGRVPPHDLEAEDAAINGAMLDTAIGSRVLDILKPEHCYSPDNGRILQAVQTLHAAQLPIDHVAVASWIRDRQWPAPPGGWPAYLAQRIDSTPVLRVENVAAQARIVVDKARLRRLIATCQRVSGGGYGDVGEVQKYIDEAHAAIGEIQQSGAADDLDRFSLGVIAAESAAETYAFQGPFTGAFIDTGIAAIDEVTGLYQNEVTLLGAPKGLGKTTLARWISDRVARGRRRLLDGRADCPHCQSEQPCSDDHAWGPPRGVLVFQLEGTRRDWSDYAAAKAAKVNLFDRRNGRWTTDESTRFIGELEALRRVPIAVDDRKDLCRANLGARIRAWRDWFARKGAVLELVVLDYFQIGAWERGGDSREGDMNDAGRHLIRLATDTESDLRGLAWLVISALNKDGGTRESGSLEYHCDTFWRLSEGKGSDSVAKALRLWIEKQRRGPSKIGVAFCFDQAHGRFW